MSFASQAREEIARRSLQKDCCVRAAAYGIACFAKYFDASGLVLQTEQELTTQVASQLFARCGVQGDIIEKQRPSGVVYEFSIRAPEQVARMHELFGTTGTETSLQIDPRLIRCQTCVSAYIGAAFLCSGTVTDPQKEYNIEFLTSRTNLARDFEALLAEHEFAPHRTRRNGVNLVYVKSCDNVERILSFMGAAEASAQLSAQKAVKQMRNQINRHTNCDTANLGKTARANAQTLKAIRFLEEQGALETLPEALQQAAARRLEYPDLSLTALCGCFDPPMSKSGLSHRMKKLEALADALRQRPDDLVRIALFELVIADVLQYEVVNRLLALKLALSAQRPRQPLQPRVDRLPVRADLPLVEEIFRDQLDMIPARIEPILEPCHMKQQRLVELQPQINLRQPLPLQPGQADGGRERGKARPHPVIDLPAAPVQLPIVPARHIRRSLPRFSFDHSPIVPKSAPLSSRQMPASAS